MTTLERLQKSIIPLIINLEENADAMLDGIVKMKIDGWLGGEYNLYDQKELVKVAIAYCETKPKPWSDSTRFALDILRSEL